MIVEPSKAAYFAGHFDGEGWVYIQDSDSGRLKIQVSVSSCNLPVLLLYREAFGGIIRKKQATNITKRPAGEWRLCSRVSIIRFLLYIEPYCVEKKQQVELCLNFLSAHVDAKPTREELNSVYSMLRGLKKISYDFSQFSKQEVAQDLQYKHLQKEF